MNLTPFIVATAGHVDHGKSALVKALTGTDPDRLPEEKARGITIDLGFAHLVLPMPPAEDAAGGPKTGGFSLGLVDVPGHEDFVKNMVAGVGSIDLALFIIAADDGWMPQTEEHLQILSYLGVRHAVIALTKIDLVAPDHAAVVTEQIRAQLRETPFATAPIIPTSVVTGHGLEELKRALATTLATVGAPLDVGKPRLAVDRVFTLHGIGTVVTGTLGGGTLRRNQTVSLQPAGRLTRIRSLQSNGREIEQALPGTRVALSLPDLSAASDSADGVSRGQVITLSELGGPTRTLDVWLERSGRLSAGQASSVRPLKDGARVRFHHGSGCTAARVVLLEGEPLGSGHQALAQVRMEAPVFVLGGDRFILRDWSEQNTLAGGLVLEADAPRRFIRDATRRELLRQRAQQPQDPVVWLLTQLRCERALRRSAVLARTRYGEAQVEQALTRLAGDELLVRLGDWVADAQWWQRKRRVATDAVQAAHREHPERPGLALSELRRASEGDLPDASLFDLLVADLCREGFVQVGTAIRHQAHRLQLPPNLQAAGTRLRTALAAKPFEPPAKKELLKDPLGHQALRFLIDTGEAIEVAPDLVMLAEQFTRARELIQRHLRERGSANASELRQLLATNRRVIIPLLERLDRDGVTLRQGDARVLRTKPT